MAILVTYCYATSYHKLSNLEKHTFIILQFLWVRNLTCLSWVLCSKPPKAAEKVATGLHCHLEAQVGGSPSLNACRLLAECVPLQPMTEGPSCLLDIG